MSNAIRGNMVGSYSSLGKTFVITDESGSELTGVVVDKVTVFDAQPSDVKINKTFAGENGVQVGTDTKTYRTTKSSKLIRAGAAFSIQLSDYNIYDYTQFQCMIAKRNTSTTDSVSVDRIGIYDNVYGVNSAESLSVITKNSETQSIDLNITNDTTDMYYIHFITFKEE